MEDSALRPRKQIRGCFKCYICQQRGLEQLTVYPTVYGLKRHIFAVHSLEKGFLLKCNIDGCVAELWNRKALSSHIARHHHGKEWIPYACNEELHQTGTESQVCDNNSGLDGASAQNVYNPPRCLIQPATQNEISDLMLPSMNFSDEIESDSGDDEDVATFKQMMQMSNEDKQMHTALSLAHLKANYNLTQVALDAVLKWADQLTDNVARTLIGGFKFVQSRKRKPSVCTEDVFQLGRGLANVSHGVETEWMLMTTLKKKLGYVEPETVVLHESLQEGGHTKVHSMQYVPILDVLKLLFRDEKFRKQLKRVKPVSKNVLEDFRDGSYCNSHELFSVNPDALQLQFYYDGFEVVNPLGSKIQKHNIGAVYFSVLNLDPVYRSSLKSICLTAFVYESDIKHPDIGWEIILKRFNRDLMELEKVTAKDCVLRTRESFDRDQAARDVSGHAVNSVKSRCFIDSIYFHRGEAFAADIHHDVLEGMIPGMLKPILKELIVTKQLFTLTLLNSRISTFDYGPQDSRNRPSVITDAKLKEDSRSLKQYAAQYWCLLRKLSLIIGDQVPEDDIHWNLLLQLVDVVALIMSPKVDQATLAYLEMQQIVLFREFTRLFPAVRITPKMHYTLHYPRLMKQVGPLIRHWVMRFEAKHHFFKRAAVLTGNFINVAKTLATRHQMLQAVHVNQGGLLTKDVVVMDGCPANADTTRLGTEIAALMQSDVFSVCRKVSVHGTIYTVGTVILTGFDKDGGVQLGEISEIFVSGNYCVCFTVYVIKVIQYSDHFHSWQIEKSNHEDTNLKCILHDSLPDYSPVGIHYSCDRHSGLYANFRYHVLHEEQ